MVSSALSRFDYKDLWEIRCALRSMRLSLHEGDTNLNYGICSGLARHLGKGVSDEHDEILAVIFRKWDQFSGNVHLPVKSPKPTLYIRFRRFIDRILGIKLNYNAWCFASLPKWDRRTKYGQDRWDLLLFAIGMLESEITIRNSSW